MSEGGTGPQTFAASATITPEAKARCERILGAWMDALNRHDAAAMQACMGFPHVRLAAHQVTVYDAAESNPMDLFTRLRDEDGWDHSAWTQIELVQSSPNKAHYAVQYTRYRADGSTIGVYNSLYVMTLSGGDWKIQCRSSFGP